MELEKLKLDRLRYNPLDKDFEEQLCSNIEEFKNFKGAHRKKIFTWVVLMYDVNSPMIDKQPKYWLRKYNSCEYAGFKPNADMRFDEGLTKMMTGQDKRVNSLINSYIESFGLPEWELLISFSEMQHNANEKARSGSFDKEVIKTLEDTTKKIKELTRILFGSGQEDEINLATSSLYEFAMSKLSLVRPEDFAIRNSKGENSNYGSPHGEKYEVDKMEFLSDNEEDAKELTKRGYGRIAPKKITL